MVVMNISGPWMRIDPSQNALKNSLTFERFMYTIHGGNGAKLVEFG